MQFSPSRVIDVPLQRPSFFKNQMPWYLRLFLVVIGGVMVLAALIVIAFVGLLFHSIATT